MSSPAERLARATQLLRDLVEVSKIVAMFGISEMREDHNGPLPNAIRFLAEQDQYDASASAQGDWQPIETAPNDGTWIDVLCENGREDVQQWDGNEWNAERGEGDPVKWKPRAAAPAAPTGGEGVKG